MSRIRTCTSASNISSCEFVQRLEKTCKMVVVLNVVACALNSDVSKNKEKCWCGGPLIITCTVLVQLKKLEIYCNKT